MATSEGDEAEITVISRRRIGKNDRFEIFLDDIEDGREHRVKDYVVVVPRVADASGITGIAVLPIRDGCFGMMRIYRHPYGGHGWEIPMGFMDTGESPERAAVREMEEETGLKADPSSLVSLGGLSPAPSVVRARINLYAVDAVGAAAARPADEAGHGRFEWIAVRDALALADRREIVEPCTLISIYRYLRLSR